MSLEWCIDHFIWFIDHDDNDEYDDDDNDYYSIIVIMNIIIIISNSIIISCITIIIISLLLELLSSSSLLLLLLLLSYNIIIIIIVIIIIIIIIIIYYHYWEQSAGNYVNWYKLCTTFVRKLHWIQIYKSILDFVWIMRNNGQGISKILPVLHHILGQDWRDLFGIDHMPADCIHVHDY